MIPEYYAKYERRVDRCHWCDEFERQEEAIQASARALVTEAEAITRATS